MQFLFNKKKVWTVLIYFFKVKKMSLPLPFMMPCIYHTLWYEIFSYIFWVILICQSYLFSMKLMVMEQHLVKNCSVLSFSSSTSQTFTSERNLSYAPALSYERHLELYPHLINYNLKNMLWIFITFSNGAFFFVNNYWSVRKMHLLKWCKPLCTSE